MSIVHNIMFAKWCFSVIVASGGSVCFHLACNSVQRLRFFFLWPPLTFYTGLAPTFYYSPAPKSHPSSGFCPISGLVSYRNETHTRFQPIWKPVSRCRYKGHTSHADRDSRAHIYIKHTAPRGAHDIPASLIIYTFNYTQAWFILMGWKYER